MRVIDLAQGWGMQVHELRAWADDLLDGCENDISEIPADVEATLREAYEQDPSNQELLG